MVKFGKNGSDAVSGALKLARAHTGRDLVAICGSHPFFSVDDWFIGASAMPGGVPAATRAMTLKFNYNDLDSVQRLFEAHPGRIAAIVLEAEKELRPPRASSMVCARCAIAKARVHPRRDDHRLSLAQRRRAGALRHPARPVDLRQGARPTGSRCRRWPADAS
jgi:hypothetical protein